MVMTMLRNDKSILVYGLNDNEIDKFQLTGIKIIAINDSMLKMKVKDIVAGLKFQIFAMNKINEKIVLFNNLSDEELNFFIGITKAIVENPILAVVTPMSIQWEFASLAEHLIEEREWHRNREKGRA